MNSDWFGIGGGDGFYTAVDPTDYNIVITESQDGATNRYNLAAAGAGESIRPSAAPAARAGWRRRRGGGGLGQRGAGSRRSAGQAPPVQVGGAAGRLRRARRPAERAQRAARRRLPLQLEHAGHHVAAQPEDRVVSAATGCSSRTTRGTPGSPAPT